MKLIYRVLLTCNSILLFFAVYAIKKHWAFSCFKLDAISYVIYAALIIVAALVCLLIGRLLPDDSINGDIKEIELADATYLPSYLGYFFVALSINDDKTMLWVGFFIFIFTFFSQTLYFNPIFLLFGYHFYYVSMKNGLKLFVLSRKEIRTVENLSFNNLKRINDFTFIDRGDKK